jgi:hypothetical protein
MTLIFRLFNFAALFSFYFYLDKVILLRKSGKTNQVY